MSTRPPLSQPSPEVTRAANEVLRVLLADDTRFLDSASVGKALFCDPNETNPKEIATAARRSEKIFGVWDGSAYRYPRFQFDADGKPRERLEELIELLPSVVLRYFLNQADD